MPKKLPYLIFLYVIAFYWTSCCGGSATEYYYELSSFSVSPTDFMVIEYDSTKPNAFYDIEEEELEFGDSVVSSSFAIKLVFEYEEIAQSSNRIDLINSAYACDESGSFVNGYIDSVSIKSDMPFGDSFPPGSELNSLFDMYHDEQLLEDEYRFKGNLLPYRFFSNSDVYFNLRNFEFEEDFYSFYLTLFAKDAQFDQDKEMSMTTSIFLKSP